MLVLAAAATLAACSDTHVLTGKFRSAAPMTIAGIDGFEDLGVELVLGHFGAEVAGVVRFYDKDFAAPVSGTTFCNCRHLLDGTFGYVKAAGSEGDALTFTIEAPSPCTPAPAVPGSAKRGLKGILWVFADGTRLEGRIGLADSDLETAQAFAFERPEDEFGGEPGEADRNCDEGPPPT
jgi:hypothetical protein